MAPGRQGQPSPSFTLDGEIGFAKEVIGQKIVWQDTKTNLWYFYRYLDSPLSDAAMTLSEYECGSHYRNLMADFKPGVTGDRLAAFLTRVHHRAKTLGESFFFRDLLRHRVQMSDQPLVTWRQVRE